MLVGRERERFIVGGPLRFVCEDLKSCKSRSTWDARSYAASVFVSSAGGVGGPSSRLAVDRQTLAGLEIGGDMMAISSVLFGSALGMSVSAVVDGRCMEKSQAMEPIPTKRSASVTPMPRHVRLPYPN